MIFLSSCASAPGPSAPVVKGPGPVAEMYAWIPPAKEKLELRRTRQRELDDITGSLEKLYLKQEGLVRQMEALQDSLQEMDSKTVDLKNTVENKISLAEKRRERIQKDLAAMKTRSKLIGLQVRDLAFRRAANRYSHREYKAAIRLFHDGKYKKSIGKFKNILGKNPPRSIRDNIRFGMGTAYYKIRKYSQAIRQLDTIVKKYPRSDKWYLSQVMLGFIYNLKGEKSRALFILEGALKKNPPESIIKLIRPLIHKIQGEGSHGTG
ncbi:MAG: tol-pal system YbgF family protein [Nitrospinaceae bacterium]